MPDIWELFPEETREQERETRSLPDGIYDLTGVREVLVIQDMPYSMFLHNFLAVKEFAQKYPDFRVGIPYQCLTIVLLSDPPKPLAEWSWTGKALRTKTRGNFKVLPGLGNLSRGAAVVLEGCPERILILAEND